MTMLKMLAAATLSGVAALSGFAAGEADGSVHGQTGFYRISQKGERWTFLDPAGREFFSRGTQWAMYKGFYCGKTKACATEVMNNRIYANRAQWDEETIARLKDWGFTTIGWGCDRELRHRGLPYTVCLDFGRPFVWNRNKGLKRKDGSQVLMPDVFDPEFETWCEDIVKRECTKLRDDPELIGYFLDNELGWAELEADNAYLRKVAERYFSVCVQAIRRYDKNHLILGCRMSGVNYPLYLWDITGKWCDVVTFNFYGRADLARNAIYENEYPHARELKTVCDEIYAHAKKPLMITEWSCPGGGTICPNRGGSGHYFRDQAGRVKAHALMARAFISLPYMVGYDHFMWQDDCRYGIGDPPGETSNFGLVNERGVPHPQLTDMFRRIHARLPEMRTWAYPKSREPGKGVTLAEHIARFGCDGSMVRFYRRGEAYGVATASGFLMEGRLGGKSFFDYVRYETNDLGTISAAIRTTKAGQPAWPGLDKVVSVDWKDGKLTVVGDGACDGKRYRITARFHFDDLKDWFWYEITSIENIGEKPLDVHSLFPRWYVAQGAAYAPWWSRPVMFEGYRCGAWALNDQKCFGQDTESQRTAGFVYHKIGEGHYPDAAFYPGEDGKERTIGPGEKVDNCGTCWTRCFFGLPAEYPRRRF